MSEVVSRHWRTPKRFCIKIAWHFENYPSSGFILRSVCGGTRWRTGGEVKGKLANGVGSQYSHATSERGLSSITQADSHTSAASSRLNWRPHRFKWTLPFKRKTKSGFCACAIRFRTSYTTHTTFRRLKLDSFSGWKDREEDGSQWRSPVTVCLRYSPD